LSAFLRFEIRCLLNVIDVLDPPGYSSILTSGSD
jgi:hypothetical protein